MFLKKEKKEELKEAPLGYWEEKSYMLAVPENDKNNPLVGLFDRVSSIDDVEIVDKRELTEKDAGYIKLRYKGEEYEVGFYPSDFVFAEYCINKSYYFSKDEVQKLREAKVALTIFMKFNKDSKKSYHLQLKLALAMVPDLIGVMDESAEKILPPKWVKMTANSNIYPGANDLYNVQAVSDKNGEVWLHSHGLCRCGLTELEILQSDVKNYNNHYNLLSTYASYLIDKRENFNPTEDSAYIGILSNRQPIVVTCLSWTKGLGEYKNLNLGNIQDRKNGHNSKTSLIFLYKSEEDEKNKKLSKVSEYDDLWGENPIFFISNEETARMKALAMERFDFVKREFKLENTIIIKIGLHVDDGGDTDFEHIWFELLEFDGEKFKAKLTQEPYNVKSMHQGDETWFTVKDVTDWIIYTPNFPVNPGSAYMLI